MPLKQLVRTKYDATLVALVKALGGAFRCRFCRRFDGFLLIVGGIGGGRFVVVVHNTNAESVEGKKVLNPLFKLN